MKAVTALNLAIHPMLRTLFAADLDWQNDCAPSTLAMRTVRRCLYQLFSKDAGGFTTADIEKLLNSMAVLLSAINRSRLPIIMGRSYPVIGSGGVTSFDELRYHTTVKPFRCVSKEKISNAATDVTDPGARAAVSDPGSDAVAPEAHDCFSTLPTLGSLARAMLLPPLPPLPRGDRASELCQATEPALVLALVRFWYRLRALAVTDQVGVDACFAHWHALQRFVMAHTDFEGHWPLTPGLPAGAGTTVRTLPALITRVRLSIPYYRSEDACPLPAKSLREALEMIGVSQDDALLASHSHNELMLLLEDLPLSVFEFSRTQTLKSVLTSFFSKQRHERVLSKILTSCSASLEDPFNSMTLANLLQIMATDPNMLILADKNISADMHKELLPRTCSVYAPEDVHCELDGDSETTRRALFGVHMPLLPTKKNSKESLYITRKGIDLNPFDTMWLYSGRNPTCSKLSFADLEALGSDSYLGQLVLSSFYRSDPWGLARLFREPVRSLTTEWRIANVALALRVPPFMMACRRDKRTSQNMRQVPTFANVLNRIPGFQLATETWVTKRFGKRAMTDAERTFHQEILEMALALVTHPLLEHALLGVLLSATGAHTYLGEKFFKVMSVISGGVSTGVFDGGRPLDAFLDDLGRVLAREVALQAEYSDHYGFSHKIAIPKSIAALTKPLINSISYAWLNISTPPYPVGSQAELDASDKAVLEWMPLEAVSSASLRSNAAIDACFMARLRLWYRIRFVPCLNAREFAAIRMLYLNLYRKFNDSLKVGTIPTKNLVLADQAKSLAHEERVILSLGTMSQGLSSQIKHELAYTGAKDMYLLLETLPGMLWALGASQADPPAWDLDSLIVLLHDILLLGFEMSQQTIRDLCTHAAAEAEQMFEHYSALWTPEETVTKTTASTAVKVADDGTKPLTVAAAANSTTASDAARHLADADANADETTTETIEDTTKSVVDVTVITNSAPASAAAAANADTEFSDASASAVDATLAGADTGAMAAVAENDAATTDITAATDTMTADARGIPTNNNCAANVTDANERVAEDDDENKVASAAKGEACDSSDASVFDVDGLCDSVVARDEGTDVFAEPAAIPGAANGSGADFAGPTKPSVLAQQLNAKGLTDLHRILLAAENDRYTDPKYASLAFTLMRRIFPIERSSFAEVCRQQQLYSSIVDRDRDTDTSFPWPFRTCAEDIPREREALKRAAKLQAKANKLSAQAAREQDCYDQREARENARICWEKEVRIKSRNGLLSAYTAEYGAYRALRTCPTKTQWSAGGRTSYKVEMLDGLRHGHGTQWFSEAGRKMSGTWVHGVKQGVFLVESLNVPLTLVHYTDGKLDEVATPLDSIVGSLMMKFM